MSIKIAQLNKRTEDVIRSLCDRLGYSFIERETGWIIEDNYGRHLLSNHEELSQYLTRFLDRLTEKDIYLIMLSK